MGYIKERELSCLFDKEWLNHVLELQTKVQDFTKEQYKNFSLDKDFVEKAMKMAGAMSINANWHKSMVENLMPNGSIQEEDAQNLSKIANLWALGAKGVPEGDQPAFNINETKDFVTLAAPLPGLKKKEDISLELQSNILYISGVVQLGSEISNFNRVINLPYDVVANGASASYHKGYLIIRLPRVKSSYCIEVQF
jgi:HSP20 family molecular chaperone IbpA